MLRVEIADGVKGLWLRVGLSAMSLEYGAFRRNRHCEERSDEAIQMTSGDRCVPLDRGRFARDDGDGAV